MMHELNIRTNKTWRKVFNKFFEEIVHYLLRFDDGRTFIMEWNATDLRMKLMRDVILECVGRHLQQIRFISPCAAEDSFCIAWTFDYILPCLKRNEITSTAAKPNFL